MATSHHFLGQMVGKRDSLDPSVSIIGIHKLRGSPTNPSSGKQPIDDGEQMNDHFGKDTLAESWHSEV